STDDDDDCGYAAGVANSSPRSSSGVRTFHPPRMRMSREKLDIMTKLRELQREEPPPEDLAVATLSDPLHAVEKVTKALDQWEAIIREGGVADDASFASFLKTSRRVLTTQMTAALLHALAQLEAKLADHSML